MYFDLLNAAIKAVDGEEPTTALADSVQDISPARVAKVSSRALSYASRHRGQFFAPEYDLDEIQIAQDTDSYLSRAILKKVNRVITAGWEWVGNNPETVEYVRQRTLAAGYAAGIPFEELVEATAADLFRFNNCGWVKVRSARKSPGDVRTDNMGTELAPVAGYFILPFETLQFKTKGNGEIKKVLQKLPDGRMKEFSRKDFIHFYTNKKPGFSIGTPELLPALDDIALLRRIEENMEDLIETSLFPVFHYQVGSDQFPERYGPDGTKESDLVKRTLEYMPAGGIYVSDHRHKISAIGSEGKSLRIDWFVQHVKQRVFSAIGTSAIDMGEGGGANRSTAGTISKSTLMDIEAMTVVIRRFIEFHVVNELLLEGGYNPFDKNDMVYMKFGVIDKQERRATENNQVQLFTNNVKTQNEVRKEIGLPPLKEEDLDDMYYKKYTEPNNLLKAAGPGSAAALTLAAHPNSNITSEAVEQESTATAEEPRNNAAVGRPPTRTNRAIANLTQPANQHGVSQAAPTGQDHLFTMQSIDGSELSFTCSAEVSDGSVDKWRDEVIARYLSMSDTGISFDSLATSMLWRLEDSSK